MNPLVSSFDLGDRVDTPFGLGVVSWIGEHPDLLGGPYVRVELEAEGMTADGNALLSPEDIELFQRGAE